MAKEKIEIIASVETYKNLSSFESIDTLNEAVRSYIERFKDQLNKTHIAVLKVLHGYSAKHLGVSFLTKRNIGKLVGKSRATIIRVCNHLEDLGIIKQLEMNDELDQPLPLDGLLNAWCTFLNVSGRKMLINIVKTKG